MTPAQGDIWWAGTEDQRRPVLVVTRSESIPVLNRILVAPVTRTVRGIPTELPLDAEDGLPSRAQPRSTTSSRSASPTSPTVWARSATAATKSARRSKPSPTADCRPHGSDPPALRRTHLRTVPAVGPNFSATEQREPSQ